MKKLTKVASIGLITGLAFSLAGCSNSDDAEKEIVLGLGNVLADSHPWNTCGAQTMKESLENSETGIRLDVFPAGQTQADTLEQLDALQSGTLDITFAGPAQLATRHEQINILDAAYLFRDVPHLLDVTNGEIGDKLFGELTESSGLKILSTGYYGTRHVTANKEIKSPADLNGVKIRVIDSPLWIDNAKAIGAEPAPVAFAELYLALQQGVVDAEENPLPTISSEKFYEVQDFINLTAHNIGAESIVVSETALSRLSEDQRAALDEAAVEASLAATQCVVDEEERLLTEWSTPDSPITIVKDVDTGAFEKAAAEYLLPKYGDLWGDLHNEIRNSK